MGGLARIAGLTMLIVPLFAGPVGRGYHGVRSGTGLPPNADVHVPFVGNQHWGSGRHSSSYGYGRHHFYPGLFGFPYFPVTDWNSYLGDPSSYYQAPPPPPADPYQANPYLYAPPQQAYSAPQPSLAPQTAQAEPPAPMPPLVLVLHSGQRLQLTNYAIVDDVLWDFSKPATHKIPVSSIDLAASAKATEDSGGDFPQFSTPEQAH